MTADLSEEEKIKIYPDEKGKQIHKKIREKALECEYLNAVNKVKDNKNQNRGEKDEILLLMKLFYLNKTQQYEKLVEIFGGDAIEGITLYNMKKPDSIIKEFDEISKAGSNCKADAIIKMNKTEVIYKPSIKSKKCSNPSIMNVTSRSKFCNNMELSKFIPSLDILIEQYLDDDGNKGDSKSEVDRKLCSYLLTESEKEDIVNVISYFMFCGTGKGPSVIIANSVMEYDSNEIKFRSCITEQEKKDYVLENWNNYVISTRGHKLQTNGKIRSNGIKISGPEENDKKWVCYYTVNNIKYPRGALAIRVG